MKMGFSTGRIGLVSVVLIALSACASARKNGNTPEVMGPSRPAGAGNSANGEAFGPFAGESTQPIPPPNSAAELVQNPDRVVLVLGPGLTHGYSNVGVIKAIHDLKIPIHAIYGTEVGALVGAIYFTQPNPNRIDWALMRFTEKNLRKPEGGLSLLKLKSPEGQLEEKLREVFGEKRVENFADRLHILLEDAKTGEKLEAKSGDLWRALRGALAGVNGFDPADFEGRTVKASTRKVSEEFRVARQSEGYPVVVVMTGKPPTELFRKLIEQQKSTLIYIPLAGIDDLDVKKRNQATFAGKTAVQQAATELLGLVGRRVE